MTTSMNSVIWRISWNHGWIPTNEFLVEFINLEWIWIQLQICFSEETNFTHQMIEFPPPNSRALLPTFSTNFPDGSHFAQMGSHFAQNTTSNPCSLLSRRKPLSGICTYTKHPQPHPRTPLFLAWYWKWAKWTTFLAKWTPSDQNVWKVGKMFIEVGKKIIHSPKAAAL